MYLQAGRSSLGASCSLLGSLASYHQGQAFSPLQLKTKQYQSITDLRHAHIIYYNHHRHLDGSHHSDSCRLGCIAICPHILPFRLYVRSCQLHSLGSQCLVPVDGASSVSLPSSAGFMVGFRCVVVHLLSVPPSLGRICHHILLHGIHRSLALQTKASRLLADAHSPSDRMSPPSHSWHLSSHPFRHRLSLRQGRRIHSQIPKTQHLTLNIIYKGCQ